MVHQAEDHLPGGFNLVRVPFPGAVTPTTLPGRAFVVCALFRTFNCLAANVYVPVGGYKSTLQPVFTYLLLLFEDVFK